MAVEAERLLKGTGWLPEVLRRADLVALQGETSEGQGDDIGDEAGIAPEEEDKSSDTVDLPAFLVADLPADLAQMIAAE
jgi:ParB family chromosome partitioning protein